MWKSLPSPSTGPARTSTTMSGNKKRKRAASATPWDGVPHESLTPAQSMVAASHRSMYAFRHERFDGDAEFFNGYPRTSCPFCGGQVRKNGRNRAGVQKYLCRACGRASTPVTGTIFDNAKLPVSAWVDFLLQAFSFASTSLMTREDRRSDTTLPYWMAKLFAVLDGIQDGVVLSGRVWIDETYVSEVAGKLWRRPDGKLPRGLSRNKLCIGVGVDDGGRSVYILEGKGKVTTAKTWNAFGGRIAPGSALVHDMEAAHNKLARELRLRSEAHNGALLMGAPDELNPLDPVNRACFLLKTFLRTHSGFDRSDLKGYLDLFHVIANAPEDKMEKAAMVLDRAMRCPKTLRFRGFYNVNASSESRESEK